MTLPDDNKTFSKEDLDLITDKIEDDSGDKAGDEGETSPADAKIEIGEEGKEAGARSKAKPRESLFEDDDDESSANVSDELEKDESADGDKDKKPPEKKEADWRDDFVALALKGKENEFTAAKLEKRREAMKNQLARYKSPQDYMLAGLAAQEKLRSGEYRRAKLPDDASEEEVMAWRKEMGLPDKAGDYEIPKIPGHKWTEEDTPFIDNFKQVAHEANIDQGQLDRLSHWYAKNLAEQQDAHLEALASLDRQDLETLEDGLRAELGAADYRPASKLVQRFLKDDEQGVGRFAKPIREARYPDENGSYHRLINHPDFIRWMIDVSLQTYGDASLTMGDGKSDGSDRMKEIEKIRDTDITKYWQEGLDKEYSELMGKREAASRPRRRVSA